MKNKLFTLIIPMALIPYFTILNCLIIFFSADNSVCKFIIEEIFRGNGLLFVFSYFLYILFAVVLSIIFYILSFHKKFDALVLAKCSVIIKISQLPAYICIFILGICLLITIFTYPVAILLYFINCITLTLTGLITVTSTINAVRNGTYKVRNVIWVIVLQFIFCADVVTSVIYYNNLKKIYRINTAK